ncbi:MAG: glycine--tRNA ligase subunit alpha [Acidobacteriota bacterium]
MATTLQQVIDRLTGFWHGWGCALIPPSSFEVPLGLLHPEAFFRLLDPEAWQAAFLQPISRPADARGGRHPFRKARHLQLQVVLGDAELLAPRQLMASSLAAVGFDLEHHDLRFEDSDLTIAAAGVLGRGWQVVLDGLRIGRVSFLEAVAGRPPAAVTAELSYGVERLAMARSGAADVYAIPWQTAGPTGTRHKRSEEEQEVFRYSSSVAGADFHRAQVAALAEESRRCLEAELPRMAYELAVRILPSLDHLEARGSLGQLERERALAEVGGLVLASAELYRGARAAAESREPGGEA